MSLDTGFPVQSPSICLTSSKLAFGRKSEQQAAGGEAQRQGGHFTSFSAPGPRRPPDKAFQASLPSFARWW